MLGFLGKLRLRIDALLSAPEHELTRWRRFLRFDLQVMKFSARRLHGHHSMTMSSALSFRTIFAALPAIVLAMLVLRSLGVLGPEMYALRRFFHETGIDAIQVRVEQSEQAQAADEDWVEPPEPPERRTVNLGQLIEQQLDAIGRRLTFGAVGPAGIVLLIWTALTLLMTVEHSLNVIFEAPHDRPPSRKIVLYWSVLTLFPIILIAAAYGVSVLGRVLATERFAGWLLVAAGHVGQFLLRLAILAGIYKLMPNTRVRLKAAVGGALAAAPLWLLAMWGFSLYVTHVAGTGVYSALALMPLALMWLNLSWLLFLFGAQVTFTLDNLGDLRDVERAQRVPLGPWDLLAATIAVAQHYQAGGAALQFGQLLHRLQLPRHSVRRLMRQLEEFNVVLAVERHNQVEYVLARPAESIAVCEVFGVRRPPRPLVGQRYDRPLATAVEAVMQKTHQRLEGLSLQRVLAEVGVEARIEPPAPPEPQPPA